MPRPPAPSCLYCAALPATGGSECPECGREFDDGTRNRLALAVGGGLTALAIVVGAVAAAT